MKRYLQIILTCIAALVFSLHSYAQDDAIGKFFNKYVNDERFTVVSVSPRMFRLFSKIDWDSASAEVKEVVQNLTSLRILSTETTPQQFYQEATKKIDMRQYQELMTVRDKGSNVRFLVQQTGNTIHELLMLVGDKDEFMLMSFTGNIDLDKISKLGQAMNIKGMDQLGDLKKKKS